MNTKEARHRLAFLLQEKSVRTDREFTLKSGRKSDFFIDCKQTILTAVGHMLSGELMYQEIVDNFPQCQAVAGVELGGCPLASAVSYRSFYGPKDGGLDALYVRKAAKDHGTKELIEGKQAVPTGSKVVLLEDVTTTGGSSLASRDILVAGGYDVIGIITLVDRLEGAIEALQEAQVPFRSIFTQKDLR